MLHGTQVVCSDIPSLREETRGAAHYVPANDAAATGALLAQILDQPVPSKEDIRNNASVYSWEACARGVLTKLVGSELLPKEGLT